MLSFCYHFEFLFVIILFFFFLAFGSHPRVQQVLHQCCPLLLLLIHLELPSASHFLYHLMCMDFCSSVCKCVWIFSSKLLCLEDIWVGFCVSTSVILNTALGSALNIETLLAATERRETLLGYFSQILIIRYLS